MKENFRNKISIFFVMVFMALIAAPTVIMSVDDSIDITLLCGENEEEEKESLKLLFEITNLNSESHLLDRDDDNNIGYTFKTYPKPHFNLILPPPEFIS